jgi:hypothetical protein
MKWPEDKVIVMCGRVSELPYCAPGSTRGVCRLCGEEVWVSKDTPAEMAKAVKEKEVITGYDFCCNKCADGLLEGVKKEDITQIDNPRFQDWKYN